MIRAGDLVRVFSRGWGDRSANPWRMSGTGIPQLIVKRVSGPCPCAHFVAQINGCAAPRPAHYHITCTHPTHPIGNDSHYTLRETRRPWQMRSDGTALHVVGRATTPPQADLFA